MANRRALLIGIGPYDHLRPAAEFADEDAKALGKVLRINCGYLDVKILTNGNADRRSIEEAFQAIALCSEPDDTFVFFFAGHGITKGSDRAQYLLLPSATAQQVSSSDAFLKDIAINVTEVAGRIRDIRARYKVILTDACRDNPVLTSELSQQQGSVREDRNSLEQDNLMQPEFVLAFRDAAKQMPGDRSRQSGVGIVHACKHGYRAFPWREKRQGVFCYSLVCALRRASMLQKDFGLHWILNDVGQTMALWNNQKPSRLNQNFAAWTEGNVLLGKSSERPAQEISQSKRVVREVLGRVPDAHYGHLKGVCSLLPQQKMDVLFVIGVAKSPRGVGTPVSYVDTSDTVWLETKVSIDIHLYAFEYGPDTWVYQHFPLAYARRNWLGAGQYAWLPSEELGIPTRRQGKTFFLAIASEKPLRFCKQGKAAEKDYSVHWQIPDFRTEMEGVIRGLVDGFFGNWGWAMAAADVAKAIS